MALRLGTHVKLSLGECERKLVGAVVIVGRVWSLALYAADSAVMGDVALCAAEYLNM